MFVSQARLRLDPSDPIFQTILDNLAKPVNTVEAPAKPILAPVPSQSALSKTADMENAAVGNGSIGKNIDNVLHSQNTDKEETTTIASSE